MPGRRCTGYDEYEGVFGPLGVYGSAARHARGAGGAGFPSASRKSSRRYAPSLTARSGVHSNAESRERYLAARHAKRRLQPFDMDGDSGGSGSEHEDGATATHATAAPVSPRLATQRQVWLPTRNFSFRQRAGKLDMRAIARLDLDRVVATTDIDAIQRHLENLAFADVTLEDVQHYSDAYFLKLFQIAQLTLEYLLNVQDSLVAHSESVETQCDALLIECQKLESENSAFATEIAGLKTEIRQKQRTLATFEVMLLNASVAQRRTGRASSVVDKENAAAEANAIVDSLLGADEREEGVVADKPVDCVVCGKKFLSPAYLVRHQQRKHQRSKRSNRSPEDAQSQSHSDSSSGRSSKSKRSSKRERHKTAPLPPEVLRALDEKTALTQQLAQLQEQLRLEKAARDAQTALLEQQQSQLASQVVGNMSQLQDLLLAIEKKQEATKQDVMQYTQATIVRLQNEAANAQALRRSAAAASRAGGIESDDDDERAASRTRAKAPSAEREANERHEKQLETMLQVLMKAQTQQQQALDTLAQENSKLWSQAAEQRKKSKSKTRHRHDDAPPPLSALLQMAALDAQRFGVDAGDSLHDASAPVAAAAAVRPVERVVVHEDKLVQTDDEGDDASKRPVALVKTCATQEVQTDAITEAKPVPAPSVVVGAAAKAAVKERTPPKVVAASKACTPATKEETEVERTAPPLPVNSVESAPAPDPSKRLQHAAQVVGKVARGFLVRRELQNPSNWLVCLSFAALETALSEDERRQLHERSGASRARELVVEVDIGMTANELRLHIARALTGRIDDDAREDSDVIIPIDYHRVLLHHTQTREELVGDRPIHALKHRIEVEIVPSFQAAEEHVDSVFALHSNTTERLRIIRQASAEHADASVDAPKLRQLVQLQARIRSFLAKRTVAMMRIDRLVDERLRNTREAAVKTRQRSLSSDRRGSSRLELTDPVVVQACQQVRERLTAAVRERLGEPSLRVSPEAFAEQLQALEQARRKLPQNVQARIESLESRLEHLMQTEYDPELAQTRERERDAARTIQSAVHVAIARRRLQILLGQRKALDEPLESFDDAEIKRLANAYEDGEVQQSMAIASPVALDEKPRSSSSSDLKAADELLERHVRAHVPPSGSERPATPALEDLELAEEKPKAVAPVMRRTKAPPPLTPVARGPEQHTRASTPTRHMAESVGPGRSPRPKLQDKEVISPFSKTPLLSRRSGGASSRRGSGFDNAR